jgi:hypothetical protein
LDALKKEFLDGARDKQKEFLPKMEDQVTKLNGAAAR